MAINNFRQPMPNTIEELDDIGLEGIRNNFEAIFRALNFGLSASAADIAAILAAFATAGYLKTTAEGVLSVLAPPIPVTEGGTGTITTFTSGSIIFAGPNGVYAQNNTKLFWDDTNFRLGVGTNSPQGPFHVQSDDAAIIERTDSSSAFAVYRPISTVTGQVSVLFQLKDSVPNRREYGRISGEIVDNNGITRTGDLVFQPAFNGSFGTERMRITGAGLVGIGTSGHSGPQSQLHIAAGSATANTAPLQLTSGPVETTPRAGVIEFTTDDFFATITTGPTRKAFVLDNGSRLTSGRVPFATTNGRLIDDSDLTFATDTLTATKIIGTTSIKVGDGSAAAPSYGFTSNAFDGFYWASTGNVIYSGQASACIKFSSGITIRSAGTLAWAATDNAQFGTPDTDIQRAGAAKLNLTNTSTTGVGLDFSTDALLKIRTRAQTGDAKLSALLVPPAGTTAAGTAPLKLTSGTNMTTAEAGAVEFTTDDFFATITTGAARKAFILDDGARLTSGKIPIATTNGRLIDSTVDLLTAGGIPSRAGSGRSAAQTAAVASVSTYTVGAADKTFYVSANVLVTTSTLHNFTVTCAYTDESNTARTLTLNFSQLTGAFVTAITNATGAGPYEGVPVHIRCKASTTITIATTGVFTTVTYNVEGSILQIN